MKNQANITEQVVVVVALEAKLMESYILYIISGNDIFAILLTPNH